MDGRLHHTPRIPETETYTCHPLNFLHMALLKKLHILALPLFLTGCYEDYYPRIDTEPVLCLNSLITAGSPIEVKVSHTWLYTDEDARANHSVPDAVVNIFANDRPVDAGYVAQEGDHIRIHASSMKYGEAEAEVTVPVATHLMNTHYSTPISRISVWQESNLSLSANIGFDIRISMDIADPDDTDNFHRLAFLTFFPSDMTTDTDGIDQPTEGVNFVELWEGRFSALDPVFYEHVDTFEDIMSTGDWNLFFSDRLYHGEAKTLTFGFTENQVHINGWQGNPDDLDCGWLVTLFSISESYYNWLVYAKQSSGIVFGDFGDLGLADPIWGYSNVSTGAGVVAAQSSVTATINLKDFLEKIMESGHSDR